MKKFCVLSIALLATAIFAQVVPSQISSDTREQLSHVMKSCQADLQRGVSSEKAFDLWATLAMSQEQIGDYAAASKSNAEARTLARNKNESARFSLGIARCALFSGRTSDAREPLEAVLHEDATAIRQQYIAQARLLSIWCDIAEAKFYDENSKAMMMLRRYATDASMETVWPSVLYSIWWLTGDKDTRKTLLDNFPNSMEAQILMGKVDLMPTAVWFLSQRGSASEFRTAPSISSAKTTETVMAPAEIASTTDTVIGGEPISSVPMIAAGETSANNFPSMTDTAIRDSRVKTAPVADIADSPDVEGAKPEKVSPNDGKAEKTVFADIPFGYVGNAPSVPAPVESDRKTRENAAKTPTSADSNIEYSYDYQRTAPRPPIARPAESEVAPRGFPPQPAAETENRAADFGSRYSPTPTVREKQRYQQVGVFRDETNATSFLSKIAKLGLEPEILHRYSDGTTFFVVAVPDPNNVVSIKLQSEGYDSFTIFE